MQILLYEPEIPPNTGNVARLCAAYDITLNLVEPLGFKLEDRYLKRAGLDYWPHVSLKIWPTWEAFVDNLSQLDRLVMATTKTSQQVQDFDFGLDDILVFGPETRGLPKAILDYSPYHIRVPMLDMAEGGVRSLNLSTAAGIVLFTALNISGLIKSFS